MDKEQRLKLLEPVTVELDTYLNMRLVFRKEGVGIGYVDLPEMHLVEGGSFAFETAGLPTIRISIEKPKGGE